MTLSRRITLAVGCTLLLLTLTVFGVAGWMVLDGFQNVERRATLLNVSRAQRGLDGCVDALSTKLSDWSSWDDTYRFVEDRNEEFVKANLGVQSLRNLRLAFLMIVDARGELVIGVADEGDPGRNPSEAGPLPKGAGELIERRDPLMRHESIASLKAGVVALREGPHLIASRPILTSEGGGPARGTIVFASRLDQAAVSALADRLETTMRIVPLDGPLEQRDRVLEEAAGREGGAVSLSVGSDEVLGATKLKDARGDDAFLLVTSDPRFVFQQARVTAVYLLTALLLVCAAATVVTLMTLRALVLRRVARLHAEIGRIGAAGDLGARVACEGEDELAELGANINRLLGGIEDAQSALALSERRLRLLVHGSGMIAWEADPATCTFTFVSGREDAMLGFAREEWLRPGFWSERLHPEDRERAMRDCAAATAAGQDHTLEYRMIGADGRAAWLQDFVSVEMREGRASVLRGILIDITERKLVEHRLRSYTGEIEAAKEELEAKAALLAAKSAELEQARRAAESSNLAKSEFLANMSHEIRTPMTAILGFADLLMDPHHSAEERAEHVQVIRRNGDHLLGLINDILDLSKIEAGKMTVERLSVCPVAIAGEVINLLRVRATQRRLQLVLELDFPLPEKIQTDPVRLRQVLLNLVGNAIKFTVSGSVTLRVSVPDPAAEVIRFEILDTGIGMTAEQIERLFRPFTQADSSVTRAFGGTGLGLTISRSIARMLGGDIMVSSQYEKGSCFVATLATGPLEGVAWRQTDAECGPVRDAPAPAPELPGVLAGARVLLAEDGPDNQRLISFHLQRAGAEVDVASNGRAAAELVLNGPRRYDLILMDMQMPELDGYAATQLLRARGHRGPIVALTAHAMTGDRERCLSAGCDDYLTKPVDRAVLLRTCRAHVDASKARSTGPDPPARRAA